MWASPARLFPGPQLFVRYSDYGYPDSDHLYSYFDYPYPLYPGHKRNYYRMFSHETLYRSGTRSTALPGVLGVLTRGTVSQGHSLGLAAAVRQLLAAGGWRALWRGLGARTLSLAGTMTVVPVVIGGLSGLVLAAP